MKTLLASFLTASLCLEIAPAESLTRVANTTLSLPASPPTGTYTTAIAFTGLTFHRPVASTSPPGETNRLFVVEQSGRIIVIPDLGNPNKETFLDLSTTVHYSSDSESGLLGLAFHPNYAANGYFYVFYSLLIDGLLHQRLSRFGVSAANPNRADTLSEVPMISQRDQASNHNGGDLHFGPEGYLYVSLGDEGGSDDQYDNARFIDKDFFSAIMRIDVDQSADSLVPNPHAAVHPNTYSIPPDNPFVTLTGSYMGYPINETTLRTEFWAAGFRNPWRFCFDPFTGDLLCGDVGQNAREEIDLVTKGKHYGWSFREGTIARPGSTSPPDGFEPEEPLIDLTRTDARSIIGGRVYRGQRFSELYGAYLFGDYATNRVWALRYDSQGNIDLSYLFNVSNVSAFGIDPRNDDILIMNTGGELRRLVRSSTLGTPFPSKLSETGAFSNLSDLTPHPGIVPYEINHPFWSDGAVKQRWFAIPNIDHTMTFAETGAWTFPTGQVWIKHFEIDLMTNIAANTNRRLETRFLVKTVDGIYGVTYRWNEAQTDADLVAEEGAEEILTVQTSEDPVMQTWRYPSRGECLSCHNNAAGHALGFHTAQLNRWDNDCHQLEELSAAGYFSHTLTTTYPLPRLAAVDDSTQNLEHRARSYLAVNCGPCHRADGPALGLWDARNELTTSNTGIVNGVLLNTHGDPDNRVIVPNEPLQSMILQRLLGNGVPKMPPVGSNVVDTQGANLILDWIEQSLPSWQSYEDWQQVHFTNPSAPEAQRSADPDGDDRINEFEFLGKTDPWDNLDLWNYGVSTSFDGDFYYIDLGTVEGRAHLIERSADGVHWQPWNDPTNALGYIEGLIPSVGIYRVPTESQTRQFYRVRLLER